MEDNAERERRILEETRISSVLVRNCTLTERPVIIYGFFHQKGKEAGTKAAVHSIGFLQEVFRSQDGLELADSFLKAAGYFKSKLSAVADANKHDARPLNLAGLKTDHVKRYKESVMKVRNAAKELYHTGFSLGLYITKPVMPALENDAHYLLGKQKGREAKNLQSDDALLGAIKKQTVGFNLNELQELSNHCYTMPKSVLLDLDSPVGTPFSYVGLSIDGGGVRGLIPLLYAKEIERITGKNICDLVDCIGGTSIGGIVALGLVMPDENGRPKYKAENLVDLIRNNAGKIFPPSKGVLSGALNEIKGVCWEARYPSEPLESLLNAYFQDAYLSTAVKPVIVTAYETKKKPPRHRFDSLSAVGDTAQDFLIREVARATSAAPTYFPAKKIRNRAGTKEFDLVDGGLWLNNPSELVFKKICQTHNVTRERVKIISLGTGNELLESFPLNASKVAAALPLINHLMAINEMGVDERMLEDLGDGYLRVQASLPKAIDLADVSAENLDFLTFAAEENFDDIEKIARFMLKNYEKRQDNGVV